MVVLELHQHVVESRADHREDNQEYREVEHVVGLYLLELRVVERDEETDRHGAGDDYPVPHDIEPEYRERDRVHVEPVYPEPGE